VPWGAYGRSEQNRSVARTRVHSLGVRGVGSSASITGIEPTEFASELEDVGTDGLGVDHGSEPGHTLESSPLPIRFVPTDAPTYHAADNGCPDSPEAYADFAEECPEMGSPGFEIHGWGGSDDAREDDSEVAAVRAVGERVGSEIDLLCDPACEYETFADALAVATACDERGSVWYEDPYPDGGISQHAHGTPIRIVGETRRCSTPNRTRWSHAATARCRTSQKTYVGLRTGITRGARPCSCLAPRYSPY